MRPSPETQVTLAPDSLGGKALPPPQSFPQAWPPLGSQRVSRNTRAMSSHVRNGKEKRRQRRYILLLPVRVRMMDTGTEQQAVTRDVSTKGISMTLGSPLAAGSLVELTLTFQSFVTAGDRLSVRCGARVIRVAPLPGSNRTEVAATIESHGFVRS